MVVFPGWKRTYPVQQYLHSLRSQVQTELPDCSGKMSAVLRPAETEKEVRPIMKRVKGPSAVRITSARNGGLNRRKRPF